MLCLRTYTCETIKKLKYYCRNLWNGAVKNKILNMKNWNLWILFPDVENNRLSKSAVNFLYDEDWSIESEICNN